MMWGWMTGAVAHGGRHGEVGRVRKSGPGTLLTRRSGARIALPRCCHAARRGVRSACRAATTSPTGARPPPPPPAQPQAVGAGQVKVALILPLSAQGNAAAAAQSMRNAAEMALAEFNNPDIQLLVKDDGGNAGGAQQAVRASHRGRRRDRSRAAVRPVGERGRSGRPRARHSGDGVLDRRERRGARASIC